MIFACVLGFTNIESSNNKNKKPVKSAKATKQAAKPAKHVKHNKKEVKNLEVQSAPEVLQAADDHNIQVDEQPVQRGQKIMDPVIDSKIEQLKNGEVVQTVTTKQVVGNKVVTKTESWTWYDYAKAAALVAGVAAIAAVGVDYFANDSKGMNYVGGQAREGYDYSKQGLQSFGERLNEGYAYGKGKLNDARTSISNRWYGIPAADSAAMVDADLVVPAQEVASEEVISEAVIPAAQEAVVDDQSGMSDENAAPQGSEEAMSDENGGNYLDAAGKLISENPKTAGVLTALGAAGAAQLESRTGAFSKGARYAGASARAAGNSARNAAKNSRSNASNMSEKIGFAPAGSKMPNQYARTTSFTEGTSGAQVANQQAFEAQVAQAVRNREIEESLRAIGVRDQRVNNVHKLKELGVPSSLTAEQAQLARSQAPKSNPLADLE